VKTAIRMSEAFSQGVHVAALKDEIRFYKNGQAIGNWSIEAPPTVWKKEEQQAFEASVAQAAAEDAEVENPGKFAEFDLPFKKKEYRAYPGFRLRTTRKDGQSIDNNPKYESHEWQKMVFDHIVSGDGRFLSASLFGPEYAEGHNLQAFDTVIHLDRNTWSNENMKQRTARAWRQGQDSEVEVVSMDFTFKNSEDQLDRTLDEIRKYFQALEGDIFNQIIKQSQETELGSEWFDMIMTNAGQRKVDLKLAETVISPYLDAGV